MLASIDPTKLSVWKKLQVASEKFKEIHIQDLFKQDLQRFDNFKIEFEETIFLDYSKNIINEEVMQLLHQLAHDCQLKDAINQLFVANKINQTESKAVLHTALRDQKSDLIILDGENIIPKIQAALERMKSFSNQVYSGQWLGYTDKPITDVVNIGIGGSDLGPKMMVEALKDYQSQHVALHFVSNADGSDITQVLEQLSPETTLFLVSSKSFTTQETLLNANTAKKWFLSKAIESKHIAKHFAAMSTNKVEVSRFGIDEKNRFEFWDWVGGRYSWCSAIGLSIACSIGFENFSEILKGASRMDTHFKNTAFEKNIPVVLALIGIWYRNFFNASTEAVFPYDQRLNYLVSYLQQINMESNGKSVDRSGALIDYQTGPVIWGGTGTNAQHSFYQLLHQGTQIIPSDFLAAFNPDHELSEHHSILLSNFFAQTAALAFGNRNLASEANDEHRILKGNHPSNSIVYNKLTPETLGALVAMYEHKIFVQGVIWNIFSFDQWGVELGKKLANKIHDVLQNNSAVTEFDSSTNGLINLYKKNRN